MSCLTAYVDHIYNCHITTSIEPIDRADIEVVRYGVGIEDSVKDVSYRLGTCVKDVHKHIRSSTTRSTSPLVVTIGIVCTHNEIAFLDVSPEDICWITPDMGVIYEVTSNVDWKIKF